MADNYTLTEQSVRNIAKSLDEQNHQSKAGTHERLARPYNANDGRSILALSDGVGVTGMTYDADTNQYTLGNGTVDLMQIAEDGKLINTNTQLAVSNCCTTAVAADTMLMIVWCGGRWIVVVEDCG